MICVKFYFISGRDPCKEEVLIIINSHLEIPVQRMDDSIDEVCVLDIFVLNQFLKDR